MKSNEIRKIWLDFFKSKGHEILPSSSLVPHNDPSLLWINSGMAPLKKYFDGSIVPNNPRLVSSQKCMRTNDIENVGFTARHHTFFEMLGNFSIGDYFRNEALTWAYELLTSPKYFAFTLEELYVTYHPLDKDTYYKWLELGIPEDHLISTRHNFWMIGSGPSGPNTEIFIDRGIKYDSKNIGIKLLKEDLENDRYIEIWNIVFSQFNAIEGKPIESFLELPHKNIDTGAGLERITCILQKKDNNFETDLFVPIIEKIKSLATLPYENENRFAYHVIADHIRSATMALADGAVFGNVGRGYVLRRIIRRAIRFGKKLGINRLFLSDLVDVVIEIMGDYYTYLNDKRIEIKASILEEEIRFLKTLNEGESLLNQYLINNKIISGEIAFKLYDTFGFPIDLTKEIAFENNVKVDLEGYEKALKEQKERSRLNQKKVNSMSVQVEDLMNFKQPSTFLYDVTRKETTVIGLFKEGVRVKELQESGEVILKETPFYATSGGQINDIGSLLLNGEEIEVVDVIKLPHKQHLHFVILPNGLSLKEGDVVEAIIAEERRFKIARAHSSVHLLQSALIKVLGENIHQAGSYVGEGEFRFDFTKKDKVSLEVLNEVEKLVNKQISMALVNDNQVMSLEEAKETGAIALFDEKYGETVRVVSFGDFSKEFCGGTHVSNTQDIGIFIIDSEGSIGNGIRRIEGRVSYNVYEQFTLYRNTLTNISKSLKQTDLLNIENIINNLINENKDNKSKLDNLEKQIFLDKAKSFLKSNKIYLNEQLSKEQFITVVDLAKQKYQEYLVLSYDNNDGKVSLAIAGKGALDTLNKINDKYYGKGGGKPDFVFGSLNDVSFEDIIKLIK